MTQAWTDAWWKSSQCMVSKQTQINVEITLQ